MDIETSKNDNNLDESYEEDNFEMNSEIIEEKLHPKIILQMNIIIL